MCSGHEKWRYEYEPMYRIINRAFVSGDLVKISTSFNPRNIKLSEQNEWINPSP